MLWQEIAHPHSPLDGSSNLSRLLVQPKSKMPLSVLEVPHGVGLYEVVQVEENQRTTLVVLIGKGGRRIRYKLELDVHLASTCAVPIRMVVPLDDKGDLPLSKCNRALRAPGNGNDLVSGTKLSTVSPAVVDRAGRCHVDIWSWW